MKKKLLFFVVKNPVFYKNLLKVRKQKKKKNEKWPDF